MALVGVVRDALSALHDHGIQRQADEKVPGRRVVPTRVGGIEKAPDTVAHDKIKTELIDLVARDDRSDQQMSDSQILKGSDRMKAQRRRLEEVTHLNEHLLDEVVGCIHIERSRTIRGKVG